MNNDLALIIRQPTTNSNNASQIKETHTGNSFHVSLVASNVWLNVTPIFHIF